MTAPITVLGSRGFIGSQVVQRAAELGVECRTPARDEHLHSQDFGHVIYCIGLTADFRSRPFETVEAHVCKLRQILEHTNFDSLLYVSSTRLYGTRAALASEDEVIEIDPVQPNDLYNASKLMGESLTLNCGRPTRVARLSNIYGQDFESENFLSQLIRDSLSCKEFTLGTALDSAKDYLSVKAAADLLIKIAASGRERLYNVAAGFNVSHAEIIERLSQLTACRVTVAAGAPRVAFPRINVNRIKQEFDFQPTDVREELGNLVAAYRQSLGDLT